MAEDEKLDDKQKAAFPFLEIAVAIDRAREAQADLSKVLAANAQLWMQVSEQTVKSVETLPKDALDFVHQTAGYMVKAAMAMKDQVDQTTVDTLIKLNLNMSELILGKRGKD